MARRRATASRSTSAAASISPFCRSTEPRRVRLSATWGCASPRVARLMAGASRRPAEVDGFAQEGFGFVVAAHVGERAAEEAQRRGEILRIGPGDGERILQVPHGFVGPALLFDDPRERAEAARHVGMAAAEYVASHVEGLAVHPLRCLEITHVRLGFREVEEAGGEVDVLA